MGLNYSNAFGDVRAELDHEMLDHSFYEWQDYRSLFESDDRFIVVGRRGTGKSALTYRLSKVWRERKHNIIIIAPNEEHVIGLRPIAGLFGRSVSRIRAGMKIAWRYAMLMEVALVLYTHYKHKKDVENRSILLAHVRAWESSGLTCIERVRAVLRSALNGIDNEEDRIADLGGALQLNRVAEDVSFLVKDNALNFVILIDRLDEGYEPDEIGVGIIDGIIYGVDEIRAILEKRVRACVFVRDNIFRERLIYRHARGTMV